MAVGNQATLTQALVNSYAAQLAIQLRSMCQQILTFQAAVVALGLTGLQGIGFTAADAQIILNMANYMATIAQVYQGTATQATTFNFENALTALTGIY